VGACTGAVIGLFVNNLPLPRSDCGSAVPRGTARSAATTAAITAAAVRELIALHQKTAEHHVSCIETYEAILIGLVSELNYAEAEWATPRQFDLVALGLTTD
jgi:hypothetical protein